MMQQVLSMSRLGGAGAVAQLVSDVPLQSVEVTHTKTYSENMGHIMSKINGQSGHIFGPIRHISIEHYSRLKF